MNDNVNHPAHYTSHPSGVECLEITRELPFTLGNAVKYVWRADMKNGLEDLRKAEFYLQDWVSTGGGSAAGYITPSVRDLLRKVAEVEWDEWEVSTKAGFFVDISNGCIADALREVRALIKEDERAEDDTRTAKARDTLAAITKHRGYTTGQTSYDCLCGEPCGTKEEWRTHFVNATTTALNEGTAK